MFIYLFFLLYFNFIHLIFSIWFSTIKQELKTRKKIPMKISPILIFSFSKTNPKFAVSREKTTRLKLINEINKNKTQGKITPKNDPFLMLSLKRAKNWFLFIGFLLFL